MAGAGWSGSGLALFADARGDASINHMHTILIVDDNAGFRVQARAILEADGFEVIGESPDGASGLADARRLNPQLILLDIGLPDVEGFQVAQELAAGGAPPPFVVLTSSREASAYGPRLTATRTLGFVAKDELSGAAIRSLLPQAS
jgi:DNA-binding NarL/FixJ family response regulator